MEENLAIVYWRVAELVADNFTAFCEGRGTEKSYAGAKVLAWFHKLPPLTQSQILEQAPDDPRVTALVIKFLVDKLEGRPELDDLWKYIGAMRKAKKKPRRRRKP